jgi:hypothetical protein
MNVTNLQADELMRLNNKGENRFEENYQRINNILNS